MQSIRSTIRSEVDDEMSTLTIQKRSNSRVGVFFSPRSFRGPYQRIEYKGLAGCGVKRVEDHLTWMCDIAGCDLRAGRFSLSRCDVHKPGLGARGFLREGIKNIDDHKSWSSDDHHRCIGSWLYFPGSKDAPRVEAISLLGEPQALQRLEDFRVNVIMNSTARPERLQFPENIQMEPEEPRGWDPARIVIYPSESHYREPMEKRRTDHGLDILLNNPIKSNNDASIEDSGVSDEKRARGLQRLFDCNALQLSVSESRETYRIKRIELISLEELSTSGHNTWSITAIPDSSP